MKAFLLFRDRDFDMPWELRQSEFDRRRGISHPEPPGELPWSAPALMQDLELNVLFNAMALGDRYLFEVVKKAVLCGVNNDPDTIRYRQAILKDCLKNPSIVRDIYNLAVETIESEKKNYWGLLTNYPSGILGRSLDVLPMFVSMLKKLKAIADEHTDQFESEGFRRLFAMLKRELSDEFFAEVQNHVRNLKFRGGALVSAQLGVGNKGIHYVPRQPAEKKLSWREWLFARRAPAYTLTIADRDENGARALRELQDRGINLMANTLAQSNDHILSFFTLLRVELAFYMGCLNLHGELVQLGEPICFPLPVVGGERKLAFLGLYDVSLALTKKEAVVGNDLTADDKTLMIITGANQGGKSTFLRSIGLGQLMMQCGLFAPARAFCANVCDGLYTHYKREEDATMSSGKLDEELRRMSAIVDRITPNATVLLNESFAATNEREGAEIARQIVSALTGKRIKVLFVTHLYELAHGLHEKKVKNAIFLRAERQPDGSRTFKISEGEPLQTSYGEDLYCQIFGNEQVQLSQGSQAL
jgi:DNA mismatch repair ATPase MutS